MQFTVKATDTVAPTVAFYQYPGEIVKGSTVSILVKDETGIADIEYAWDLATTNVQTEIKQKDPLETSVKLTDIEVPTTDGLHVLWVRAMDADENISDWYKRPYYVVDQLSSTTDTTCPQADLTDREAFPLSESTLEVGRQITIKAVDDQTGIFYTAYRWSQEPNNAGAISEYTIEYETDTAITNVPMKIGTWYLYILMEDGSRNQSSVHYATYYAVDNTNPTLTLNGASEMDVALGSTFTDLGATFTDNYDEEKIVYSEDTVNINKVGKYVLNYKVTDSSGNESNCVTRTVTVVGTEDTIELTAPTKKIYKFGEELDLTGAQVKHISKRGEETIIPVTADMFEGFTTEEVGLKSIFFTYENEKVVYTYEVQDYMKGIKLTLPTKLVYEYKEELDLTGGFVQKVMASGIDMTKEEMKDSMVSGFSSQAAGKVTLTVE